MDILIQSRTAKPRVHTFGESARHQRRMARDNDDCKRGEGRIVTLSMRAAHKIRIHCPILRETYAALCEGNLTALESDPVAMKMLAIIRGRNPLGDFDLYRGVFELSLGIEGFTPTDRAQPTAGESDRAELLPTVIITTYVDAAAARSEVASVIEDLVRAHPWEVPVIELSDAVVQLVDRRE